MYSLSQIECVEWKITERPREKCWRYIRWLSHRIVNISWNIFLYPLLTQGANFPLKQLHLLQTFAQPFSNKGYKKVWKFLSQFPVTKNTRNKETLRVKGHKVILPHSVTNQCFIFWHELALKKYRRYSQRQKISIHRIARHSYDYFPAVESRFRSKDDGSWNASMLAYQAADLRAPFGAPRRVERNEKANKKEGQETRAE